MRNKIFLIILSSFIGICFADADSDCIKQWGITWRFDKNISCEGIDNTYRYGQFVNGDYWIIGPVKIIEIRPRSFTGDGITNQDQDTWIVPAGRTVNGSMINPDPTSSNNGYDSSIPYRKYDHLYNVALPNRSPVSDKNPLVINPGSSLISTVSLNPNTKDYPTEDINMIRLKTAAILTVVSEIPAEGSFRPYYCGNDKTIRFSIEDVKSSFYKLKSLSKTGLTGLTAVTQGTGTHGANDGKYQRDTLERMVERPWIDHFHGWSGEYINPAENFPRYGEDDCGQINDITLTLNLDLSGTQNAEQNWNLKKELLCRFIQVGIDYYGVFKNGATGHWIANGGHGNGRKWPILFAGIMLEHPGCNIDATAMANIGFNPPDSPYFSEDDQFFYVNQINLDAQNKQYNTPKGKTTWADTLGICGTDENSLNLCGPDPRDSFHIPYVQSDIDTILPEFGIRYAAEPWRCNRAWETKYRRKTNSGALVGTALCVLIMNQKERWNHPAFFDYLDRYYYIEKEIKTQIIALGGGSNYGGCITQNGIIIPIKYAIPGTPDIDIHSKPVGKELIYRHYVSKTELAESMWDTYRKDYGPIWPATTSKAATYNLAINTTNCSVIRNINKDSYTSGEEVVLTVKPFDDCHFIHWTTTVNEVTTILSTNNPFTITMDSNKIITAVCKSNPTKGQVFHAPLDDGSGSTVTDANNLQAGNLIGGSLWGAEWRHEDWLGFNQSTQAITIPTMGLSPQAGTIAVCVEPKDFSGMKFIFGHVLNNANRLSLYTVAGSLAAGLGANATLKTNITTLPLGQPVHLALSWEGTAYAVYVNGVQKAAGTFGGLTALNTFIDIGNYGDPAFRSLGFAGKIDDIRTYNRALAAEEIDALYMTQDVRQGKELQFTVNAVNAQGIPIVYQAAAMPAGASFDAATQQVTWTPWHNQIGLHTFRFTSTGQPERVVTVEVHKNTDHTSNNSLFYNFCRESGKLIRN